MKTSRLIMLNVGSGLLAVGLVSLSNPTTDQNVQVVRALVIFFGFTMFGHGVASRNEK